eukprot:Sdes_comp15811_c0_seq1m4883
MEELDILVLALKKYGIGRWTAIIESNCLPGKQPNQLNNQTQRLLGQQSTAEFMGLHIDPLKVKEANDKLQGPDIKRKNGCIINTGNALSAIERKRLVAENKEKYGIDVSEYSKIELPDRSEQYKDRASMLQAKKQRLEFLKEKLAFVQQALERKAGVEKSLSSKVFSILKAAPKEPVASETPAQPINPTSKKRNLPEEAACREGRPRRKAAHKAIVSLAGSAYDDMEDID